MAAMRAIWKGSISFGLVGIGVKLYSATEEKDFQFHQVHAADGGRISMHRVCRIDGNEVPYSEIVKGLEISEGEIVMLTDEDLAEVPVPTNKSIAVLEFVPEEQVDPLLYARAYYLAPDGEAAIKPYLLLLRSLEQAGRVGIVKIALRQREHLAAMRVRDGVLVLTMMLWPDEVREPDFAFLDKPEVTLRPQERAMAESLVESMAGEFHPEDFTDDYREALGALVAAKVEGREIAPPEPEKSTKAADLLSVLTASVERARQAREPGVGAAKRPEEAAAPASAARPAPAKQAKKSGTKTTPKPQATPAKTSERKATAKATPAKKSAGTKAA